jgi:hypothetical protein
MIYEIIGLPGSGKTSFSKELILTKRRIKYIQISNTKDKIFYNLIFMIENPVSYYYLLFKTIRENYFNLRLLKYKLTKFLFRNIAKYQKSKSYKMDSIIDEGLIYYIFSLYERKISKNEIIKSLYFLPLNKIYLIILETNDKIRYKRMKQRKRIPRKIFGKKYQEEFLEILDYNGKKIIEILKRIRKYYVIKGLKVIKT